MNTGGQEKVGMKFIYLVQGVYTGGASIGFPEKGERLSALSHKEPLKSAQAVVDFDLRSLGNFRSVLYSFSTGRTSVYLFKRCEREQQVGRN